ncbi:PQQ-dependent sugar dehydrogenase [Neolewinella lacunae]|uniref:PQQ-dependent sugar dehydrogenase n=1 Tax=Neolewinella lacunae TaxID=1517758 RepID=A0A923TDP8_9BACT|nr:PQQ-dependent sugar dehydrogenase [Neolewinella lacunae]MBC6995082.1 PQQ-dependent sugar dehydrogenase [Neolewinella lacunae]MDN3635369.1 PQQ-dependent sugar dehydrogenase [Neolewinella lacunae]
MPQQLLSFLLLLCLSLVEVKAQTPRFSAPVEINQLPQAAADRYRFSHPFEILVDRAGFLWVSSKAGRISRVDPTTGLRQVVKDLGPVIHFTRYTNNNGVLNRVAQDGLQGIALHSNYGAGTGEDYLYAAYVYDADNGPQLNRRLRIVRYTITENAGVLGTSNGTLLLNGLPASNDHNGGRLLFGADAKLYYAIGDQGANQGANRCNPNLAQATPTQQAIISADWTSYQGKILRLNLDGSIPIDNPLINGVRSHIFSYGHRNPQGIAFGEPVDGRPALLYSNEHGHRTDDEVKLIRAGGNYGWPNVAGFKDGIGYQYYNWSSSANCGNSSSSACQPPNDAATSPELAFNHPDFHPPLASYFVAANPPCDDFFTWPTFAPSSLEHYPFPNGIPGWENSLLVTTLKRGTLYRLQLSQDGSSIVSDTIGFFTSRNRYRDLAISPDGRKIYLLTDSIGGTSFASGANEEALLNRGSILEISYDPAVATTGAARVTAPWTIFPNPTSGLVNLSTAAQWQNGHYTVYDNLGRSILTGNITASKLELRLDNAEAGVYHILLENQRRNLSATQRIVLHNR